MFSHHIGCGKDAESSFIGVPRGWHISEHQLTLHIRHYNVQYFASEIFATQGIDYPESVRRSVTKRQSEFLAGRICARDALLDTDLIEENVPTIDIGSHRSPVWPKGYLGSISHTSSIAACVVARQDQFRYLGLDIEQIVDQSTLADIASMVGKGAEWNLFNRNQAEQKPTTELSEAQKLTLLFSAKESLFKAVYPKVLQYFDFDRATLVRWLPNAQKLVLRLCDAFARQHQLPSTFTVSYEFSEREVLTLLCVAAT